jgi:hypothetical protein
VTPDIEIEPNLRADIVVDLERRGEFFEFAIEYAVSHEVPEGGISVSDAMWSEFVEFLGRDEFEFDAAVLDEHRDEVELAVRRDMTRRLRSREDAYVVALEGDTQVTGATELAADAASLSDLFKTAEAHVQSD